MSEQTRDDFSAWDEETLRTYLGTMEAFMKVAMEEDPLSARYVKRLASARDELGRRRRSARESYVKVSFGPEGSYYAEDPDRDA